MWRSNSFRRAGSRSLASISLKCSMLSRATYLSIGRPRLKGKRFRPSICRLPYITDSWIAIKGMASMVVSQFDLAESELGVLSSQCLDRRIRDMQTLVEEIAAWEHDRNANRAKANCHFTTPNARIKLKQLYPSI